MDNPPDFSQQLDPKAFQIQGANQFRGALDASQAGVAGVNNDWSGVNALLAKGQTGQANADALASGEGLTGASETRFGQENLGANTGSAQSLGQALMRLGSKDSTKQNFQAGQAQSQQQMEALQQATAMRTQMADQQRQMFKANLQLSNQKFAMTQAAKQARDGLDLAQVHLTNMFNQSVAGAKNAQELAQVETNQQNFAQTMQYLRMGIGAASTAAAGAAAIAASPSAAGPAYTVGQAGAGYADDASFIGPPSAGAVNLGTPQPGAGPNSFSAQQSFWGSSSLGGRGP